MRAIVGDPPLIVEYQENVELEAQLAQAKVELKTQKEEVRLLVADLESKGRELSIRRLLPRSEGGLRAISLAYAKQVLMDRGTPRI